MQRPKDENPSALSPQAEAEELRRLLAEVEPVLDSMRSVHRRTVRPQFDFSAFGSSAVEEAMRNFLASQAMNVGEIVGRLDAMTRDARAELGRLERKAVETAESEH